MVAQHCNTCFTNRGRALGGAQANGEEKATILEQAMHEVFPSNVVSEEIVGVEKEEEDMETCKEGVDLYNPLRSPLKNRNKILQEVLGIDS